MNDDFSRRDFLKTTAGAAAGALGAGSATGSQDAVAQAKSTPKNAAGKTGVGILGNYGTPDWTLVRDDPDALPWSYCTGRLIGDDSRRYGGCIRIADRWILTAHHVIDIPDLAYVYRVEFDAVGSKLFTYRLNPDNDGWFTSDDGIYGPTGYQFDLDYALIALKETPEPDDPAVKFPVKTTSAPVIGKIGHMPQYRDEGPLQIPHDQSIEDPQVGTIVATRDQCLFHKISSVLGSSGSPLFDRDWKLVAVHTHGARPEVNDPLQSQCSWGTLLAAIAMDARARNFKRLDEIPLLAKLAPKP